MQKISIFDFIRLSKKETDKICNVNKGDLVRLYHKSNGNVEEVVGIITSLFDNKMCLLINNCRHEWWSRFVNCEILAYNNDVNG